MGLNEGDDALYVIHLLVMIYLLRIWRPVSIILSCQTMILNKVSVRYGIATNVDRFIISCEMIMVYIYPKWDIAKDDIEYKIKACPNSS